MAFAFPSPSAFDFRLTERQKAVYAVIASVLLHVIAFVLIAIWMYIHRNDDALKDLKVVEVAVATPTPAPIDMFPPLPVPVSTPPVIDSDGLNKTKDAPINPDFQSDENSVAASMFPANGRIPLPSQAGKDRKTLAFETKNYTPGTDRGGMAAPPPVMTFAPAPDVPHPPKPVSTPLPKARPTPQPTPQQTPTPEPTATPTPAEQKMAAATPIPDGLEPLYKPTPVPSVTPAEPAATPDIARPTPVGTPKPVASMAMLSTPRPKTAQPEQTRPEPPGYRPQTEQNKIEGGISNRGKTGVNAIGTPVGRYQKRIADAIGSRWYFYVNQRMDLITTGSVRIKFYINQKGHVEDLKVISNEANETLANYSVQAITAAKIPPPPSELAPSLEDGRYEVTYTFTIYPD